MRKWFLAAVVLISGIAASLVVMAPTGEGIRDTVSNYRDLTRYEVRGDRMYISGELNARTPEKLKRALRDNPQVRTLVLTEMPGSLDDEALFPFAKWVREQGLNTHLKSNSKIESGAVDLFLAGERRTMEKGAKIGVHSWSEGDREAREFPSYHSVHRIYADYIRSMLGSAEFYWFTIAASPADSIHWLTEAEIGRFGLVTN